VFMIGGDAEALRSIEPVLGDGEEMVSPGAKRRGTKPSKLAMNESWRCRWARWRKPWRS